MQYRKKASVTLLYVIGTVGETTPTSVLIKRKRSERLNTIPENKTKVKNLIN